MSLSHTATASGTAPGRVVLALGLGLGRKPGAAILGALLPFGLVRALREHFRRQRDFRRLLKLPDYLLDDAGLTRAQVIEEMKRRPF